MRNKHLPAAMLDGALSLALCWGMLLQPWLYERTVRRGGRLAVLLPGGVLRDGLKTPRR